MPQNLREGGMITFRRMFSDRSPIMGQVIFIGLHSVLVKSGVPGSADEMILFVDLDHICRDQ